MWSFVLRRLISSIPVLILVSLMTFGLIWLVPGDPASVFLDASATPEQVANLRRELGLDQPLWTQMLSWYERVLSGDLGESILLNRSVAAAILERLPITLSLAAIALVLAVIFGILLGSLAAVNHGGWGDQSIMTVALLGLSIPDFWLGLVLIVVFAVQLGWLPSGGFVAITEDFGGWAMSMALPAFTLTITQIGFIARMTRSSMLDVLRQDYVRTADAKGLGHGFVVMRHALPNAMMPILTVTGVIAGGLLGGAVVVEQVFALPGVGRLIIGAILSRDFPVIQGGLLMLAVIYLLVNLIVDMLYAVIDPRVRLA